MRTRRGMVWCKGPTNVDRAKESQMSSDGSRGGPGSNQYRRKGSSKARSAGAAGVTASLALQARDAAEGSHGLAASADSTHRAGERLGRSSPDATTISGRLDAMDAVTHYGADYDRNVAEPYHTARRMVSAGRLEEAEHWTLMAEMRFGTITFEEWQASVAATRGRLF